LSLNYQNWTFLYSVSFFFNQPIYPTEEFCPSISGFDTWDLPFIEPRNTLANSMNYARKNAWVNQTTGDLYVLAPSSICKYADYTSEVSYTNYTGPLTNTTTFPYSNGFAFYNNRLYGFTSTAYGTNVSQYVYSFAMNPYNQSIVFSGPLLSYSTPLYEPFSKVNNWTSFTEPMYNGDGIVYSGWLSKNTRVNNTMNIGIYSRPAV
jgi:hypothetical protein